MYISNDFLNEMSYDVHKRYNYYYIIFAVIILFFFMYFFTYKEKKNVNPDLVLIYESDNFKDILHYNESNTESKFL